MYINDPPAPSQRTLILTSGGLDSAVALALAKINTHYRVVTVSFSYGQQHECEVEFSKKLSTHYDTLHHTIHFCLPYQAPMTFSDKTTSQHRVEQNLLPLTWTPARNSIFIALAANVAYYHDCHIIVLGVHQEDYPGYPDCREDFLWPMEAAINNALAFPVQFWVPLLKKTKTDIVRIGHQLDVPFQFTWSCYTGGDEPCGKCDACVRRRRAFMDNKPEDPLLKKEE